MLPGVSLSVVKPHAATLMVEDNGAPGLGMPAREGEQHSALFAVETHCIAGYRQRIRDV